MAARSSAASAPSTASAQASTARRAAASSTSGAKRPSTIARSSAAARAVPSKSRSATSGDRGVRDRVGGRELGDRLVVQAALVAPRRGDDVGVQVVRALGVLLDREQHPAAVALAERPVLGRGHDLRRALVARDRVAVRVAHDVALARPDADRDAVVGVVGAVDEPEVLDLRALDDLADVVPALAVEVVQPALPLDHQVRAEHPAAGRRGRGPSRPSRSGSAAPPPRRGPRRRRTPRRRRPPRPRPARPGARGPLRRLRMRRTWNSASRRPRTG